MHKNYYTRDEDWDDNWNGFRSYKLMTLCALARELRGYEIDCSSGYLEEWLVMGDFKGTEHTGVECQLRNPPSTPFGQREAGTPLPYRELVTGKYADLIEEEKDELEVEEHFEWEVRKGPLCYQNGEPLGSNDLIAIGDKIHLKLIRRLDLNEDFEFDVIIRAEHEQGFFIGEVTRRFNDNSYIVLDIKKDQIIDFGRVHIIHVLKEEPMT